VTEPDNVLAQRLTTIQTAIAQACATRPPHFNQAVTLIAVSKYQSAERVCALYDLGVRDFGENYVQECVAKAAAVARTGRTPRWHFIGGLQSNKARDVACVAHMVHTIDSQRLAQRLVTYSAPTASSPSMLMQVRQSDDPKRPGVPMDQALPLAEALLKQMGDRFLGVMAVPPQSADPRAYFAALRKLFERVRALPGGHSVQHVSMGMSEDFRAAIGEGATMVRVGTALFGPRPSVPGEL
jgi:pyridoxal phosphate enzyme (YggS family)